MKKVILLLAISCLLSTLLSAQSTPEGMNYQAVARNTRGEILAAQPISLKVKLFSVLASGKVEYYDEVHHVLTSPTGVFSVIIGKGTKGKGVYDNVPWSTENVWMEISIKGRGEPDYSVMSNSKLLAVPYAYHSITAERISGNVSNAGGSTAPPAQAWLLFGNSGTNPDKDKIGTLDFMDMKYVTNNIERMRIYAAGDIFIKRNLRVGSSILVDSSAEFNKVAGSTINYGAFTVERRSPTLLSGTLTVDEATDLNSSLNVDGITDLNSRLNVNNKSATYLSGSLNVKGITDLDSALNVNNAQPTLLTGKLEVRLNTLLKDTVKATALYQTDTTTTTTPSGALQVSGGAYIGKNLFIGGIAKFGGPAAFGGAVSINDITQSVSTSTGALIVGGGVGIGKNLNVGGAGLITGSFGVTGISSVTNNTQSTAANNGAFIVTGGAGIGRNLYVAGITNIAGATTISNTLTVDGSGNLAPGGYIANFRNSTGANGINIQLNSEAPRNGNDFVTFRNNKGGIVGRIEGETLEDLNNNQDFVNYKDAFLYEVTTGSVDVAIAAFEVAQAVVGVVAASSSSTACVGFGACITAPIPSFIIAAGTNLVLKIANAGSAAASLASAIITKNKYVTNMENNIGVTYQSGSADYAEWLPKANPSEDFKPGSVVGLKNGKISLNTSGAEKLFVISTKPIVLGNMPAAGQEAAFEKVAFMGQVPVNVLGKVSAGDYILPSGKNNGLAIAVPAAKMTPADYINIVGVAWSSSDDAFSMINVAIGLNTGDISKVVAEQSREINALKSEMSATNAILAKLIPGFKEAAGISSSAPVAPSAITANNNTDQHGPVTASAGDIVYFEVSKDQIAAMFEMAEKIFNENGGDVNAHPFWKQIKTDPAFKQATMDQVAAKFKQAIHSHKEINQKHLGK